MGRYPSWDARKVDLRLRSLGCELLRTSGSHRHYSNPFQPDRLVTFAWHSGDVSRGIIADICDDLAITRDKFYFDR